MNNLTWIPIGVLLLAMVLALLYIIPIVLISRFHKLNNILTVNVCLAIIFCCAYWLLFFFIYGYAIEIFNDIRMCILMNYLQMLTTVQIPFTLIVISFHRLCSIVYHTKGFFKKKYWIFICISVQWISGILLCLPRISINYTVRNSNKVFFSYEKAAIFL